jgi:hypothetical protein
VPRSVSTSLPSRRTAAALADMSTKWVRGPHCLPPPKVTQRRQAGHRRQRRGHQSVAY